MPVITHDNPSRGSYALWFGSRLLIRPVLKYWPLTPQTMKMLYLVDKALARGPKPKGVVGEPMTLAGRPAEYIVPSGPSRRDSDTAVLYLHGGAFVVCGLATHRAVASRLSRKTGLPVVSLAYRQLPEAGVGTSVNDAYMAYRELIMERGYRHVVVAGDSAGGFLAPKVAELAAADGIQVPDAFVGFSPLLDLDLASNPDRSSRSDAYLPKSKMAELAPMFDQGPIALRGVRRIIDVPADRLPPTLIINAQDEMLEADIIELVESIDSVGGVAVAHRFRWQVHAFPALNARHPESLEAIALAADFITEAIRSSRAAEHDTARGQAG
ncbi:alpha/beta hydrolase [Williamsia deligens]|uniref:Alpha/beta hydrolase n=1 Tax=Williamsia deligens TaxID=321325 RepID=A0ABW3G746_9NOCA|nr:alpha/beta hydrolase [Williamsia deligens]MCP2193227.1 Acetyl esterase/lipase [Williamsia deligens]